MCTGKRRFVRLVLPICFGLIMTFYWTAFAQDQAELDQSAILQKALRNHPQLRALAAERQAALGRILQASLRPNPAIEAELDQKILTESPEARSEWVPEGALAISQVMERGDKRRLRTLRARAGATMLDFEEARLRLAIAADVRRQFVILCGAQGKIVLRQEGYDLAARLAEITAERVAAGAISPIEETRSKISLIMAGKSLETARRELAEARENLAGAMGQPEADFTAAATCNLDEAVDIPGIEKLKERLGNNPDLGLQDALKQERQAELQVEQSLAYQDITVKAGVRRNQIDQETFFFAGISVPIPFYDSNQGNIKTASAGISKADAERLRLFNNIRNELAKKHSALLSAAKEAEMLRVNAVAFAKEAYEAVNEGYRFGKFRYLDVVDSGNALIDTKLSYLETVINLHLARVEVDRLVGEPRTALLRFDMEAVNEYK